MAPSHIQRIESDKFLSHVMRWGVQLNGVELLASRWNVQALLFD